MDNKLVTRIEKLLALAEGGSGGERENARVRLEKLCAKHGVNLQDFLDEKEVTEMHWFRYDNKYVEKLLHQIAYMVMGSAYEVYGNPRKQRQIGLMLTKSQAAEYTIYYEAWRPAFKRHMEDSISSFIMANKIYPATAESKGCDKLSPEELDRIMRQSQMAATITPTCAHKRLEDSND